MQFWESVVASLSLPEGFFGGGALGPTATIERKSPYLGECQAVRPILHLITPAILALGAHARALTHTEHTAGETFVSQVLCVALQDWMPSVSRNTCARSSLCVCVTLLYSC